MRYKKKYLMLSLLIFILLLLATGCSRKTYKIDNRSIVLDKEYKEFRDGDIRYWYDIYDSTISLTYPEGYKFTYESDIDRFTGFDEDEYIKVKEKYVDPMELVKILRSQPKRAGILGFLGIMVLGMGVIIYFYPDMFYAIRSRGRFRIPHESEYPTIRKISVFYIGLGILFLFLYMIG